MIKMIVMVIFSIKLISVASVCVTPASGTSGGCSEFSSVGAFKLNKNKGITPGGVVIELLTANFSTIGLCADACRSTYSCYLFDYNCLTGDCVLYDYTGYYGNALNQLVTQNGHTSGTYS